VKTTPLYRNNEGHHDGYCTLIETWGSDERIVEAARMSTGKGFLGWGSAEAPGDEKLLERLWSHYHHTPFEMGGMVVEFQCPIFVIRQVHRHRAASYNEFSARYAKMPDLFWLPAEHQIRRQGGTNKQGSLTDNSREWQLAQKEAIAVMGDAYDHARKAYEHLIQLGVANEQARAVLPVAQFTRCRMQCNLRMWLHFCGLRQDSHAQPETRALANACAAFLHEAFPRTLALFDKHEVGKPVVRTGGS
jgi:thymidylate synthase (FAD)